MRALPLFISAMAVNAQIPPAGHSLLERIKTLAGENPRRLPDYT